MDIERMVVPIEWKATDDDHVLEGYASTFGNVDLGGDVVVRGAFAKTIAHLKANGGIPLLADHVAMTAHVLGTIVDARETRSGGPSGEGGLWVKANLSRAPSAEDTRTKMTEGHLSKMSIGYEPMDYAYEDREGQRIRLLKEVKLWESSVVVFPMNTAALIGRVKSMLDAADESTRKQVMDEIVTVPAGDDPAASATSGGEEAKGSNPPEAGAPDEGVQPPDEGVVPGDRSSWDHWASEAVLAGRDPDAITYPADRAGMATRLDLIDAELAHMATVDEQRDKTDRLNRLSGLESDLGLSG
jgi:uncharacterized protein